MKKLLKRWYWVAGGSLLTILSSSSMSSLVSRIWVNNRIIDPPLWKRGGQKGNAEIPLIDEGYEYRQPVRIALKKDGTRRWLDYRWVALKDRTGKTR